MSLTYLQKPFVRGLTSNPLGTAGVQVRLDRHELESGKVTCAVWSRRRLLLTAAASAAFAACSRARRQSGSLCYLLPNEPDTLDPCKSAGGSEVTIMSALFEPLLQPDPETMAPVAGLATHYKVERGGTRYTFYLRGHPAPEGIVLADAEPARFSRGRAASRDVSARWSDGISITAHDVVCSFRRYLAPLTANPLASTLYSVVGAEAVSTGKIPPDKLGVHALDTFAFQVDLRAPEPTFLKMCYSFWTLPLPCHAIDSARARDAKRLGPNPATW